MKICRAFTLIEFLIVVLILAVLIAVVVPLYLGAEADVEKQQARANMQTIAKALYAAKVKDAYHAYPTNWAALIKAPSGITAEIRGPDGRTYSWKFTGFVGTPVISSSVATDGTFESGKDEV